jgi:hypothetical protein
MAEYWMLVRVKLKDVPPDSCTRQDIAATYGLITHGSAYIQISVDYRPAYG